MVVRISRHQTVSALVQHMCVRAASHAMPPSLAGILAVVASQAVAREAAARKNGQNIRMHA